SARSTRSRSSNSKLADCLCEQPLNESPKAPADQNFGYFGVPGSPGYQPQVESLPAAMSASMSAIMNGQHHGNGLHGSVGAGLACGPLSEGKQRRQSAAAAARRAESPAPPTTPTAAHPLSQQRLMQHWTTMSSGSAQLLLPGLPPQPLPGLEAGRCLLLCPSASGTQAPATTVTCLAFDGGPQMRLEDVLAVLSAVQASASAATATNGADCGDAPDGAPVALPTSAGSLCCLLLSRRTPPSSPSPAAGTGSTPSIPVWPVNSPHFSFLRNLCDEPKITT
uniref:Dof-type domain-containing protein n=1 Tax=Macrostomum lignano TaxID=282301 RepID=A0A1I8JRS4_9PLAT